MDANDIKLTKEECAIRRAFLFRLIAEQSEQKRRHAQKRAIWRQVRPVAEKTVREMVAEQQAFCANGVASVDASPLVGRGYKKP